MVFRFLARVRDLFVSSITSISALGPTQPRIEWMLEAVTAGLMRPGCEADHEHIA
jgi:hypothetical protein